MSSIHPQTCAFCHSTIKPRQRAMRSQPHAAAFTDPKAYHLQGGKSLQAMAGDCYSAYVSRLKVPAPTGQGVGGLRVGR